MVVAGAFPWCGRGQIGHGLNEARQRFSGKCIHSYQSRLSNLDFTDHCFVNANFDLHARHIGQNNDDLTLIDNRAFVNFRSVFSPTTLFCVG